MPETGIVGANAGVLPVLETWGWQIAIALFLCGAAAGMTVVSGILRLRGEGSSPFVRAADVLGAPVLAAGAFFLWIDLGNRWNIWRVYVTVEPTSVMWWGSWIVALSLALLGLRFLAAVSSRGLAADRAFAVAAVVLGIGLGTYTGLLLAQIAARPLWATPFLPVVFLVSAVGSGLTILMLAAAAARPRMHRAEVALWATELVVLVTYALSLRLGAEPGQRAIALLSSGLYGLAFWGIVVTIGVVMPLAVTTFARFRHVDVAAIPVLTANLIGTLSLRLVVVYAGVATAL